MEDFLINIGMESAYRQAFKSYQEGGIPVGAALMVENAIVSVGHNQRYQKSSNILHGEMDCLEKVGHAFDLSKSVLFTTLSPCIMCSGAIVLFRIPVVVIMDNINTSDFMTGEDFLRTNNVKVDVIPHAASIELNRRFQTDPATRRLWLGDVGK